MTDQYRRKSPVAERFWAKVAIGAPDECWPWRGARLGTGYGSILFDNHRQVSTHRLSFYLAHGEWPKVCRHTCDRPDCVNPRHLVDGSQADNVNDMAVRGRGWWNRDTCGKGHPYPENPRRTPRGARLCKECLCEKQRAYRARLKERRA